VYRNRPPSIESTGWLSWIRPVFKVKDEILIKRIGCDAVLYIRFVRLLRKLLYISWQQKKLGKKNIHILVEMTFKNYF
jgi:hypothetical protein